MILSALCGASLEEVIFGGLRMTSRRNNVRDIMFFAKFTDKNEQRAKSLRIHL